MRPQNGKENHPRVVNGIPFVEQLARRVAATMPHSIDIGDLVQDGVIGLIDAAHRFDEARGIKFETFAERRIRRVYHALVWGVPRVRSGTLETLIGRSPSDRKKMAVLRKGGRYVVVGLYGGEVPLSLVPMAQRALTIQGSYVGSLQELQEVVDLAKSGKLQSIPTALCTLEEVSGVLDQLKQGGVIGRVVAKI